MHPVIAAIARHAGEKPECTALCGGGLELDYRAALDAVLATAHAVRARGVRTAVLAIDNSPAWAVADLAGLAAPFTCIPLPDFFSPEQQGHVMLDAGAGCLLTDRPDRYVRLLAERSIEATRASDLVIGGTRITHLRLRNAPVSLPPSTAKITYTSGTTGAPKGVCLSGETLARVSASIAATCRLGAADRHVSLLPLATLLENVCGLYASLLAGATCVLPPLAAAGVHGGAGVDADRMLAALVANEATTTIMTPQMLLAATDQAARSPGLRTPLRFLAVGGAPLHPSQLERARACGLPAYEGYGLSECASVVTLNTPGAMRAGSVGRPLPHATVSIARDGEILVAGATALGYCGGMPASAADNWPTGDIGYLDGDGFLHLTGRKRNIFVTSFGRNVSPEWIETKLLAAPEIVHAWVWGEGRPWNAAVIAAAAGHTRDQVSAAVGRANRLLPDYARVRAWIPAERAFTYAGGELTANGRLRRDALLQRYQPALDRLYQETHDHVL
jgi:long-subunit acyl-CoA synthetase (AMP-forming)